tara:strand:- start:10571 stop:10930 length:360 start_codon:yes stop_codon:yes gene_type:complete
MPCKRFLRPSADAVPANGVCHGKGALGHAQKALRPLKAFLQQKKLQDDEDDNVEVDDEQLNSLTAKGKTGKDKEAARGKVEYKHGAEETIARVLEADGVVLQGKADELRGEGVEEGHVL